MSEVGDKLNYIQSKIDDVNDLATKIDKDLALHKSQFDSHLEQDAHMYQELKRMNDILQQNTESLKEHMQRTELLEEIATKMDARFSPIELEYIKKKAVSDWVRDKAVFVAKLAGAITGAVAVGMLIKELVFRLIA